MNEFITLVVGLLGGLFLGVVLLFTGGESHKTIIDKGYGLYCPDTGAFAFIGECDNG
jgi:hypothetical protein